MDYSRIDTEFAELYNYRDLSSAVGPDRIKPGRLARCCNPMTGSFEDIERLVSSLGTRTIVDLRDATEADTVPDNGGLLYSFATADEHGDTEGAEFVAAEGRTRYVLGGGVSKFANMGEMRAEKEKMQANWKAHGAVFAMQQMNFTVMYRTMLGGMGELWLEALQLCADPLRQPLVFHCTAGRDRTGLLAMLVLHVCGATEAEILDDYVLSKCLAPAEGVYAKPFRFSEGQVAHFEEQGFPATQDATDEMLGKIERSDMESVLRWVEAEWGGLDGYLDAIGFGAAQRAALREACAEEPTEGAEAAAGKPLTGFGPTEGAPAFGKEWAELSPRERRACRTLGWSEESWEEGDESPLEQAWEGLSRRQQTAATMLGYEAEDFEGPAARL